MMRKTLLFFSARRRARPALAGDPAAAGQDRFGSSAKAAAADTYRQLNLFGDVFERVRADYVEKPDDSKLIESAINGMLPGSTRIRATWSRRASATCRCRPAASSAGSASKSPWKTA